MAVPSGPRWTCERKSPRKYQWFEMGRQLLPRVNRWLVGQGGVSAAIYCVRYSVNRASLARNVFFALDVTP